MRTAGAKGVREFRVKLHTSLDLFTDFTIVIPRQILAGKSLRIPHWFI
jgi:hypothetical protein